MWDEEKDFDILDKAEDHDPDDEITDDVLYPELEPYAYEDENENSDVFEYETDFYHDDEEYEDWRFLLFINIIYSKTTQTVGSNRGRAHIFLFNLKILTHHLESAFSQINTLSWAHARPVPGQNSLKNSDGRLRQLK